MVMSRLDIECLDRIYLNGYVPKLQVGGQVASFMTGHLGFPIPSPAIMEKIGTPFRRTVHSSRRHIEVPMVAFGKADRKKDVMRPHLQRQAATGRSGVAAIGVAQEYQNVFASSQRPTGVEPAARCGSRFTRPTGGSPASTSTCGTTEFGPAFIKVCAYFPYPVKVWVNGHEWAKRQAAQAGIGFTELSNGFATCDDPARLAGDLRPARARRTIEVFFDRWMSVLPLPLTPADRAAGYWWELSMRQVETSRTLVFDAPRRARAFFEALVADNLDIGRPDQRRADLRRTPHPAGPATEDSNRPTRPGSTPATPTVSR